MCTKFCWPFIYAVVIPVLASWSGILEAVEIRRLEDAFSYRLFPEDNRTLNSEVTVLAQSATNPTVVATSSEHGEVVLWDLQSRQDYWRVPAPEAHRPARLQFSNGGTLLASGNSTKLELLSIADGTPVRTFNFNFEPADPRRPGFGQVPESLAFTRQDNELYASYANTVIRLDIANGQMITAFGHWYFGAPEYFTELVDFRLSENEQFLYVLTKTAFITYSTIDQTMVRRINFYDIPTLRPVRPIAGTIGFNGHQFVIADKNYAYVVDGSTMQLIRRQFVSASAINHMAVAMTEDLCCFLTASPDGTSRMYDIATGVELIRLDDPRPSNTRAVFYSISALTQSDVVLVGDVKGSVWVWRRPTPPE